jgi:hypothetical protein
MEDTRSNLVWMQREDYRPHYFWQDLTNYKEFQLRIDCPSSRHVMSACAPLRTSARLCALTLTSPTATRGHGTTIRFWEVSNHMFSLIILMYPNIFSGASNISVLGKGRSSLVLQLHQFLLPPYALLHRQQCTTRKIPTRSAPDIATHSACVRAAATTLLVIDYL